MKRARLRAWLKSAWKAEEWRAMPEVSAGNHAQQAHSRRAGLHRARRTLHTIIDSACGYTLSKGIG